MAREARVTILIQAKNAAKSVLQEVEGGLGKIKALAGSLGGALSGGLAALGLGGVAKYLYDINAETDTLLVRLKTFEGSTGKARAVFNQLQEFANKTPYDLANTTNAYITLRTRAVEPTLETMTAFGDHAAAFGRDIQEYAVAVASAIGGEMDPLKSFGVQAQAQGDKLQVSFAGVTKIISRDAQSLVSYLEEIAKTNFAGAMEDQSKTLGGRMSTLKDSVAGVARAIGDAGLSDDIRKATDALTKYTDQAGDRGAAGQMRVWYAEAKRFTVLAFDATKMIGGSIAVVIVGVARAISATVRLAVAGLAAIIAPAALFLEAIANAAGFKANFGQKILGTASSQFSAAGTQVAGIGHDIGGLVNVWKQGYADQDRLDKEVAAARATATKGNGPDGPGLKKKGKAKATTTPIGGGDATKKAALEAERQRKARLEALLEGGAELDELLEDALDAHEGTLAVVDRMVDQEAKLVAASADPRIARDAGDRAKLLREARRLRDQRHEQGFYSAAEQNDARDHAEFMKAVGAPTTESLRASIAQDVPKLLDEVKQGLEELEDPAKNFRFQIQEAVGDLGTLQQAVARDLTGAMGAFGSAVAAAFAEVTDGSQMTGAAFKAAMLDAIGDIAAAEGARYLLKAGGAIGEGLSGNLAAFGAAAKFTAAGVGLEALAGMLHHGARSVAGTGNSGRAGAASTSRALGSADVRGEATLVVEGSLLDLSDPRQEEAFARALSQISGRRVTVKRG